MSIAKYLAKLAQGVDSQGQLSVSKIAGVVDTTPTITAIAYPGDDTATDPAGGQTITLTGTNFANGAKVIINGATAGVVTVVNSTQITFVAPSNPAGSYILYVVNTNGSTAIAAPGIQYSQLPIFSVAAGSLGTLFETTTVNTNTTAASNSAITYSVQSGTLPPGVTLNSSTGTIIGTSPLTAASTTYTFTVRATDGELQDGVREFSLTINPDVINWTNPISNGILTAYQGVSTIIPIQATTGSGSSVVYSATGTPAGMQLSGSNYTGTPTALGSSTGTLTGTTVASSRTSQITFTWTISVLGDLYWPDTSVLLTGTAPSELDTFVADASLNNNQLTVVGDTRPSKFNPYQAGYYSNYFDGTGDYLTVPVSAALALSGNYTIECWIYPTVAGQKGIYTSIDSSGDPWQGVGFEIYTNNCPRAIGWSGGSSSMDLVHQTSVVLNTWNHIALCRNNNVTYLYLNGVQSTTSSADSTSYAQSGSTIGQQYPGSSQPYTGYISNLRVVKGTAVYTAAFTPSTTPLTAVSGTSLLTCQSNRLVDNSTNAFAITKAGDVSVQQFSPFAIPANTYGSAYFDGTGDYLKVPSSGAFDFGSNNFTIECWVYSTSTAEQHLISKRASTAVYSPILLGLKSSRLYILGSNGSAWNINGGFGTGTIPIPLNAWTHLAVVRNGTTVTGYVNGVADVVFTSITGALMTNTANLSIGSGTEVGDNPLFGYMQDTRIVNGTAVYTANFTPPTTPLTAVTNTSLLTLQTSQPTNNSQFVDNGPAANLVTKFGNSTQGSFNPYGSGHSLYFNGGGAQGYLNPTGLYRKGGNVTSGSVDLLGAFTFECWVYLTAGGRHCMMGSPNGWAYTTDWGFCIMDTTNGATSGTNYNPGLCFMRTGTSGYGVNFAYGVGLGYPTLNTWTHLAVSRDSSNNWHFYMNGVKGTTANINSVVAGQVQFPANNGPSGTISIPLTVANFNGFVSGGNGSQSSAGFNGYISDMRLVDGTALYTGASLTVPTQPLTPVPGTIVLIGQDSNFTNFADDKNFVFTPTSVVGNNLRADKFSKFNNSAGSKIPTSYSNYFDGTGDYFSTPVSTNTPGWNIMAPSGSGGGTVEAWINRTNNTAGSSIPERIICGCLNIGAAYTGWYLAVSSTGQLSVKGYITGNAAGPAINSGAGLVALNTWTHIAVSCVSGTITFYINGVAYAGGTMPANWLINNTATATMVGDAYPAWAAPFIGYISNLRMINNTALYTGAALTVPATPLTTTANTTLLTCQDSTFKDNSTNAYVLTGFGNAQPALANPFGFTSTLNIPYSPTNNAGSVYFDGTGDWLTLPHSPVLTPGSDFTIEFWAYPTSVGGTQEWYAKGDGIQIFINAGSWTIALSSTNNTTYFTSGAIGTAKAAVWQHIALYRVGTAYYGAVDGRVVTLTASASAPNTGTDLQYVGASKGLYPAFGYVSDLRTVSGTSMYTANSFAPPLSPLSAHKNAVLQLTMDKAAITDATANRDFETVADARITTESAYNEFNYSNYFDGTGDSLTVASNAAFAYGTGAFTVEFWVYSIGTAAAQVWVINNGLTLNIQRSTGGFYNVYDGTDRVSSTAVIPNTWNHVAVVRTGTGTNQTNLYVNGISVLNWTNNVNYAADNFAISGSATYPCTCYISNVRVVKGTAVYTANFTPSTTPLTAIANTQLLICQSNSLKDNSTNNFAITRTGDVAVRSFNPFKRNTNTSMYFDGTGDYIYAPTAGGTYNFGSATNFTIETWAHPIVTTAGKGIFQISATAGGLQASVSTTLAIAITATNAVEMYANGTVYTTAAAKVPLGVWTHLAIVRSSGVTKLYINGVLETSIGTAGSITDTTIYPNTALVVGGYYSTSYLWNGYIEDFRITKGTARYIANFTPPAFKLPNK